jgi:hypothetical protein
VATGGAQEGGLSPEQQTPLQISPDLSSLEAVDIIT